MFRNPPLWRRIRPVLPRTDDEASYRGGVFWRRLFVAKSACTVSDWPILSVSLKPFLGASSAPAASTAGANSRGKRVRNSARLIAGSVSAAVVGVLFGAVWADDFPLVGNYTQNVACKGDGSDQAIAKVTISRQEIISNVGVCTILDKKTNGLSISAHVECKFAGGPLIGDITFTPRPDNTIEFIDRDMTYKAVLYRCPQ